MTRFVGGPYHGYTVELRTSSEPNSPGTLEFTANGRRGYYLVDGTWVQTGVVETQESNLIVE